MALVFLKGSCHDLLSGVFRLVQETMKLGLFDIWKVMMHRNVGLDIIQFSSFLVAMRIKSFLLQPLHSDAAASAQFAALDLIIIEVHIIKELISKILGCHPSTIGILKCILECL